MPLAPQHFSSCPSHFSSCPLQLSSSEAPPSLSQASIFSITLIIWSQALLVLLALSPLMTQFNLDPSRCLSGCPLPQIFNETLLSNHTLEQLCPHFPLQLFLQSCQTDHGACPTKSGQPPVLGNYPMILAPPNMLVSLW